MDAAAIALSATMAVCSWAEPGRDPYVGDVLAAVDRYADIPTATRLALKMARPHIATHSMDGYYAEARADAAIKATEGEKT